MTNETKILGENTGTGKYNPDLAQQLTKQIEQEEQRAALEAKTKPKTEEIFDVIASPINTDPQPRESYIYVPSLGLYVGKERIFEGENWYDCHAQLKAANLRMPTISEFIEFIKYLKTRPEINKEAHPGEIELILDDILSQRRPERGEWLNARFHTNTEGVLYMHYNHQGTDKRLFPESLEPLEDYLKTYTKVNFNSWLSNPTKQGLPRVNINKGVIENLWYTPPPYNNNNAIAAFYTDEDGPSLHCALDPFLINKGVRGILKI